MPIPIPPPLAASWILAITLALAAPTAWATDGVAEINQTCAVQTGCFSGDTPGYPVTISGPAGKSYRLTSDLIVPDENTGGIRVLTTDVGIDLNNFSIIRSGCEGATANCTPTSGTGSGIDRYSIHISGTSVKNGSITGMGAYGVLLGYQSEVTGLRVRWNRLDGINAETGSTVSGNTAYQNGNDGIQATNGSTISRNTAYSNGGDGIGTVFGAPTISGNTAYNNGRDGIRTNSGSTVSGNAAYSNDGDGIYAGNGSTVQNNTVRSNARFGMLLGTDSAYLGNVVTGNLAGTVASGGSANSLSGNYCAGVGVGSPSCP